MKSFVYKERKVHQSEIGLRKSLGSLESQLMLGGRGRGRSASWIPISWSAVTWSNKPQLQHSLIRFGYWRVEWNWLWSLGWLWIELVIQELSLSPHRCLIWITLYWTRGQNANVLLFLFYYWSYFEFYRISFWTHR